MSGRQPQSNASPAGRRSRGHAHPARERVALDLGPALDVPHRCPACGTPTLEAVPDGERPLFTCVKCGGCWYVELGYAVPVDASRPRSA